MLEELAYRALVNLWAFECKRIVGIHGGLQNVLFSKDRVGEVLVLVEMELQGVRVLRDKIKWISMQKGWRVDYNLLHYRT